MILADMGGCFDLDQRFIFDKIADDKHRHCREVASHDMPIGLSDFALVCQVFRLVLHIPCQAGDVGGLAEGERACSVDRLRQGLSLHQVHDQVGEAALFAAKHKLDNIVFGVVSPNDPKLAKWKMHGMASNSLVLASRAKRAMITYTDLKMDDLHWLEEKLVLLVKLPDFPFEIQLF